MRSMVKVGVGAALAMLLGCYEGSNVVPPYPKQSAPASGTSANGSANAPDAPNQHAPNEMETRLSAAVQMAKDAAAIEGSDVGARLLKQTLRDCAYGLDDCVRFINSTVKSEDNTLPEKVILLSSAVLTINHNIRNTNDRRVRLMIDRYVDVAERTAKQAKAYADELVQKRAEIAALKQKTAAEGAAIDALDKECASSSTPCKTKCEAGDGLACAALANKLEAEGKKAEAQKAINRACDLKVEVSCLAIKYDEMEKKKTDAKNDSAWQGLQDIGDDVARKYFQAENFAKIANMPHQQAQVGKMKVITAAIVSEKFCPEKKAFIASAGTPEFTKRAERHCKDDPPQASGLSGAQVSLPTQCQAAFAAACP